MSTSNSSGAARRANAPAALAFEPSPLRIILRADRLAAARIPGFLQVCRGDALTLDAALTRGEFATVVRIAHAVREAAKNLELARICDICTMLEAAAQCANGATARACLGLLSSYLQQVQVVVEDGANAPAAMHGQDKAG